MVNHVTGRRVCGRMPRSGSCVSLHHRAPSSCWDTNRAVGTAAGPCDTGKPGVNVLPQPRRSGTCDVALDLLGCIHAW